MNCRRRGFLLPAKLVTNSLKNRSRLTNSSKETTTKETKMRKRKEDDFNQKKKSWSSQAIFRTGAVCSSSLSKLLFCSSSYLLLLHPFTRRFVYGTKQRNHSQTQRKRRLILFHYISLASDKGIS